MIKDSFVLLFYKLFSFIPISKKNGDQNYENNKEAWNNYRKRFNKDKYIEHQSAMSMISYGRRYSADYNSCEVIAVYNALIALKEIYKGIGSPDFPMLLSQFERRGITWGGAFGTSPFALIRFFLLEGFDIKCYNYKNWIRYCNNTEENDFENKYDTFIFMTYNNAKSIREMIHTMCITKENGMYQIHNDYECSKQYESLNSAITGYKSGKSRMIMIIGIRGKYE